LARNAAPAVILPSTDLPTLQLHALFKLDSGLAADRALFNLQLAATHISFMLSHSSEKPVCVFISFVHHSFIVYFGVQTIPDLPGHFDQFEGLSPT